MSDRTERARAHLASLKGFLPSIAERSGVSYSWLVKFSAGRIPNPTIRTVDSVTRVLREIDDGDWTPRPCGRPSRAAPNRPADAEAKLAEE